MALSAFEAAAREHLANPPASWVVHRVGPRNWQIRTRDGAVVDRCTTKTAAEQSRHGGTYVRLWQERTDWYLGRSTNPRDRPLTPEERAIVDRITNPAAVAETIRAVRFRDRDERDHQVWIATRTSGDRWDIQSLPWWTFQSDELEFLDDDDPVGNAAMLDEVVAACERWDRQVADDLNGNPLTRDAAVTVIGILRRLAATLNAR
ncbi:hypothetical protein [Mycobacterium avium]|uniref:hypothetical protein n=1 Tax=Mycobacterium avium TaxID=1764 RepID=UPI000B4A7FD5|nr:hypothetical protein [Mycobacterium avium]